MLTSDKLAICRVCGKKFYIDTHLIEACHNFFSILCRSSAYTLSIEYSVDNLFVRNECTVRKEY